MKRNVHEEKTAELEKKVFQAAEKLLAEIIPVQVRDEARARVPWDIYFGLISSIVASRGTCTRRVYGAAIVNSEHQLLGTGYVGSPSSTPNCSDLGVCFREENNVPVGCFYDLCTSRHAEENAIEQVGKEKCKGQTIYVGCFDLKERKIVSGKPCLRCQGAIINVKLKDVVYMQDDYTLKRVLVNDMATERRLNRYGVQLEMMERLNKAGINLKGGKK